MGYVGNSIKPKKTNLSIFFDVGVGFSSRPDSIVPMGKPTHGRFDINIGIGYCF